MTAAVAPSSWMPIPVRPYLDGSVTVEKPTMMIRTDREALLYPGKVHSFHGESESGKSMLAQVVAAEQIMAGRDVLYLDYESDPGTVGGRLVAMRVTPEQIDQHLVYVNPDAAPDRTGFEALLKRRYALAVVDGVTEALGLSGASSKDNDDVTGWMRSLPRVIAARTGAAVILVDHVTKSADSRGRFAIGAQAKMGALTGAGYMVEVRQPLGRGMVGVLTVRVAKDRPGYVRGNGGAFRSSDRSQLVAVVTIDSTGSERIRAAIDPPGDEVSAHGGPVAGFRPTVLMERVSRLIEGSVRPLSFNDLQDGAHSKRANVRAAVDVLLGEGFVVADPGPRNSLLHRSVKPYRQSDDPDSDSYTGGNQSSLETGSRLVPLVPVPYTREPGTSGSGSEGTGREPVGTSQVERSQSGVR